MSKSIVSMLPAGSRMPANRYEARDRHPACNGMTRQTTSPPQCPVGRRTEEAGQSMQKQARPAKRGLDQRTKDMNTNTNTNENDGHVIASNETDAEVIA